MKRHITCLMLCATCLFAAPPQLPEPKKKLTHTASSKVGASERLALAAPRVRCTTNCPAPRTNVLWFWRGDKQLQWNASVSSGITNYLVYYGPNRDSLTNVESVAGLLFLPTNCPAGTNLMAVSAVNSIGLESDLTAPIPLSVFREWVVEDWTKLKSAQLTRLALTTNYFYARTNLSKELLVRVRGTNQVTRQRTDYVGVAVR